MKVTTVIVTYNGLQNTYIQKCLDSVYACTLATHIIVVDNGSTDETCDVLRKFYPKVELIEIGENLGFGKGNNIGIKKALNNNTDFVFLLNQDAFLMPTTLERLVAVSQENPDYGIISPIHLNGSGNDLEHYFAKYMDTELTPNFYFDYVTKKSLQSIYCTDFVNAAAWLLPKRVLQTVGGFDPIFWHYGEDNNYGQRVKFHGYKIGVVSECFVTHDSSKRNFMNYQYSERYYKDYIKFLQIRFGDININFNFSPKKAERNTLILEIFTHFLRFDYKKVQSNIKKINMLEMIFNDIDKSRSTNIKKGSHYL